MFRFRRPPLAYQGTDREDRDACAQGAPNAIPRDDDGQ
jgi:hypothetical protein